MLFEAEYQGRHDFLLKLLLLMNTAGKLRLKKFLELLCDAINMAPNPSVCATLCRSRCLYLNIPARNIITRVATDIEMK